MPYFHVVFTVPEEIAAIAYQNKKVVYGILFRTTAETMVTIAADPEHLGAEIGFCCPSQLGIELDVSSAPALCCARRRPLARRYTMLISCGPNFFLPVRVLSRLFRRLFLRSLQRAFDSGKLQFRGRLEPLRDRLTFVRHLAPLKRQEWVVYAKRPFAGPHQVLDYVGRYTHRVAISNNRLLDIENGQVRFQWKDYRPAETSRQ